MEGKGRAKVLITQLRTNSHQLWCETGRWKRPKEAWEERVCTVFTSGVVESKKHFILECDAFKYIKESCGNMHCLFSEEIVGNLGQLIINLNNKRIELQKTKSRELIIP